MIRTVVYPRAEVAGGATVDSPGSVSPRAGPGTGGLPMPRAGAATVPAVEPDKYSDKLIKYVPAEVLAFYTPMAAAMSGEKNWLIATAIAGLVATVGYLWMSTKDRPQPEKPLPHFFLLAALSFVAWALCTSSLGELVGLSQRGASFILGATVLLLPVVDAFLAKMGI